LVLLGDTVHNFIDGLILAASFLVSPTLGLATFAAVSLHEIPHEIGDFSLLIKGGFSTRRALFYNFLSALSAVGGGLAGYFSLSLFLDKAVYFLPVTAGGFIYLALVDVVPQIHAVPKWREMAVQLLLILLGLILIVVLPK
jgi:zinc and cadmium transporter